MAATASPVAQSSNVSLPNTDEHVVDSEDDSDQKTGWRDCCKKVLKFMFSHIGLCGMVGAYVVGGGFLFEHLEQHNEKVECYKAKNLYEPQENITIYKLWTIAHAYNVHDMYKAIEEYQLILRHFRNVAIRYEYNGKNCSNMGNPNGPKYQWSFAGALLFSVTVITTIGKH